MRITLGRPDLPTLGAAWRELEARADASVFQSWTWVGCRAAERFSDPVLLRATEGDVTVALALFNRRRGALWLHETGDATLDAPFIERNGILVDRDHADRLPCLLRALPPGLVLSGVDPATSALARRDRALVSEEVRGAPVLDLRTPVMDAASANTRSQIRRAMRRYEADGPLRVERSGTVAAALDDLAGLVRLHTARWHARGKPGAFAGQDTMSFHRSLIERGVEREEVDLLKVLAGDCLIGVLYNLRRGGRVFAYQGGFTYPDQATGAAQLKPGLVCHVMAADWYRGLGAATYDLGAGDTRYKRSLASRVEDMHWLRTAPRWSVRAGVAVLRRRFTQAGSGT